MVAVVNRVQRKLTEIENALLGDAPLADCLRRCVSLGGDLRSAPLREWAQRELMGYGAGTEVPAYRIVTAAVLGDGEVPGRVFRRMPVGLMELPDFARDEIGQRSDNFELRGGVGTLAENARQADARGDGIVKMSLPMAADLVRFMNTDQLGYNSLYWAVSTSVFRGVLDEVRTTAVAILSEVRAESPDNEAPSPDVADQAVNVIVNGGKRNIITVTTNRSHHGDAGVHHQAGDDSSRRPIIGTAAVIVVAIAIVVAVVVAYFAFCNGVG